MLAIFALVVGACTPAPPSNDVQSPSLAALLKANADERFVVAEGEREFEFTLDHGNHPEYRNEWWYLTGNLDDDAGRRFGYELTLFRFALASAEDAGNASANSGWRASNVLVGHFALTDVAAQEFYVAERFSRQAAGLAGVRNEPLQVWLYDWHLQGRPTDDGRTSWQLRASDESMSLDLVLQPVKPVVLNGKNGLSQKSTQAGMASWYYSVPRLQTTGVLSINGQRHIVSGLSWLDREWSSSALADDQQGWDWFALQFSDGSDLMFYQLRGTDGLPQATSAGTWTGADGQSRHLQSADVRIDVLDTWRSPQGGQYPQGWRISIPSQQLQVEVQPVMAAQELETWVRYWEGAVDVRGEQAGTAINGRGYVELTGYASALPRQ